MYEVDFSPAAVADIDRLNDIEVCDVDDVLAALALDPRQDGCYQISSPLPLWQCTIRGHLRLSYVILDRTKQLVVTDIERLSRW